MIRAKLSSILVDDQEEARALDRSVLGVVLRAPPAQAGPVAVFEDTCGNLIQLCQPPL